MCTYGWGEGGECVRVVGSRIQRRHVWLCRPRPSHFMSPPEQTISRTTNLQNKQSPEHTIFRTTNLQSKQSLEHTVSRTTHLQTKQSPEQTLSRTHNLPEQTIPDHFMCRSSNRPPRHAHLPPEQTNHLQNTQKSLTDPNHVRGPCWMAWHRRVCSCCPREREREGREKREER